MTDQANPPENPQPIVLKKCSNCPKGEALKPFNSFNVHARMPDGRHTICKECDRQRQRDNYLKRKRDQSEASEEGAATQEGEQELPPLRSDSLYIFQNSLLPNMLKIGRSCNPFARASSLQASQPFTIRVLAIYPDAGCLESSVHKLLAYCRVTGGAGREWFECSLPAACGAIALAFEAAQSRD
jgi:hypothetical protein